MDDLIKRKIKQLVVGETYTYYVGESFWIGEDTELRTFFDGLIYCDRYVFTQRLLAKKPSGYNVYEYMIKRKA
jgi:hypothetical protein